MRGRWCFISHRHRAIILDLLSTIHHWKSRLFFVHSDISLKINSIWGKPYTKSNQNDEVLATDKDDFLKLINMVVPQ